MASREMELKPFRIHFLSSEARATAWQSNVNKTEVTSMGKAGIIAVIESELFPW